MGDSLDAVAAVAGAVPGVASASAHATAEAALHVRLLPGADVADVAEAVGRLLAAAVEPDVVPTVRPAGVQTVTVPGTRRRARPRLVGLDVHSDGPAFTVGVALGCDGRAGQGSARSSLTTTGVRRAMAAATLQAVEDLSVNPLHFELDLVERSDAGEKPVVIVHLTSVSVEGVQRLVGSAAVHEDEGRAVIRAALDAVNRRLEVLWDEDV